MNSINGVFNKGAFWPEEVEAAVVALAARHCKISMANITSHCLDRCDEYDLDYRSIRNALEGEVVEAYFENGNLVKVVTRQTSVDRAGYDMCCAVKLTQRGAVVVTVWLNRQGDNHATLRTENYTTRAASGVRAR